MDLRTCLAAGCLGLALAVLGAAPARAQTYELALIEPLPDGAEVRIAGQTSDLPWSLARVPGPLASLSRVEAMTGERGARAAAWIAADDEGLTLKLFDPRKRRLLERRFAYGARGDALARSAALEALALSLRSSLRALAADEDVGEVVTVDGEGGPATTSGSSNERIEGESREPEKNAARAESDAEQDASSEDEASSDDEDEDGEELEEDNATREPAGFVLVAGWNAALDGQTSYGQQGPFARIGLSYAGFEFAGQLQTALAGEVERDDVTLGITRKLVLASVAADLYRGPVQRFALAVTGGAAFFHRETRAVPAGLRPLPDFNRAAATFGVELRGAWRLVQGSRASLEIELAAGALVVPAAPLLRYEGTAGPRDHALWVIEPYLHLGPRLDLGL